MIDEDERNFSSLLINNFKEIIFLDDNIWEKEPKIVDSIEKCPNWLLLYLE